MGIGVNPYQTVYHEIGHALDHLGLEVLTGKIRCRQETDKLGRRTTYRRDNTRIVTF